MLRQLAIVAVVVGSTFLFLMMTSWIHERLKEYRYGKQLPEPFAVEVIYRGTSIAELSDRRWVDMFWYDYQISTKTEEAQRIIDNDDFWERGDLHLRDVKTGALCMAWIVGGERPYLRDGRVLLRGLYFGGKANRLELERSTA
jgi:hypothetical protein